MGVRRFFCFPGSPSAQGLGDPVAHDVLEFQGQAAETAWYNLLTKIGLYRAERRVRRAGDRGLALGDGIPNLGPGRRRARLEGTGARPRNRERCFRLDSPSVPSDRFPSLSCHKAQHSERQLWVVMQSSRLCKVSLLALAQGKV